jgi:UDP-GlcNAc:undecaprenyl-phosphate GlcNAc-1-phosphate transferase
MRKNKRGVKKMTTILFSFMIALGLSLLLTPLAGKLGSRFGAIDMPDDRKIHIAPMPRSGGIAIFLSFLLTIVIAKLWKTDITDLLDLNQVSIFFFFGAIIVFGIGLFDDFHRIPASIKLLFQIAAASVAFFGGLRIGALSFFGGLVETSIWSYAVTVFWFVLLINAINLIDGMDGLAAGISFFACIVMVILDILKSDYLSALLFAIVAGSVLGFLRYNFNPASIFMGDGGSYFLGYTIAGFSILTSTKAQMSAILLIPVLALGLPLFDTILSPLRRFIRGKKMFSPDSRHIHHRLIRLGLTTKRTVLMLYGVSCALCAIAVVMTTYRDEGAGLLLIVVGAGAFFFVRKLGYLEYFAGDKLYGWLRDLSDVAGFSHERRSFLGLQMDAGISKNHDDLWHVVGRALEMLEFDYARLNLNSRESGMDMRKKEEDGSSASVEKAKEGPGWEWSRSSSGKPKNAGMLFDQKSKDLLLRIELPLLLQDKVYYGKLLLVKNIERNNLSHYSLRRVEHLRRTICSTLKKLEGVRD